MGHDLSIKNAWENGDGSKIVLFLYVRLRITNFDLLTKYNHVIHNSICRNDRN